MPADLPSPADSTRASAPPGGAGSGAAEAVVVVVIAYRPSDAVGRVLDDVWAATRELSGEGCARVVFLDDGTGGAAASAAETWAAADPARRLRVLRCPAKLGPGGSQKLALRYAIDCGHRLVVVIPADGQYPADAIPRLAAAWGGGKAAVVLGSRMASGGGRVPLLRRTAIRAVGALQNRIVGGAITDWYTGLRAYDAAFLASIPFELHSNRHQFDTEMLLQALHAGAPVAEVGIDVIDDPTARRESRAGSALASLRATARLRAHRSGMLCSLLYRQTSSVRYVDKVDDLYSSHSAALRVVRELRPATLLDIGCGPGHVARRCAADGVRVTGVDREPPAFAMHEFLRVHLDREPLPVDAFAYDVVLLLDVIEHLPDPEGFLVGLRNKSRSLPASGPRSAFVLSTPNVAFASMRLSLLLGSFNYAERGILDIDHKRLFTKRSLLRALRDCGYEVERVVPVGVPFAAVLGGRTGRFLGWGATLLARLWPTMFAFQFLVVARPLPGVAQLVRESQGRE